MIKNIGSDRWQQNLRNLTTDTSEQMFKDTPEGIPQDMSKARSKKCPKEFQKILNMAKKKCAKLHEKSQFACHKKCRKIC